ncbi:phosphatidylinositol-specific phospholipase C domain-containing protein [Photobacterium damselae]|uniref:phosphatidylinositol-specific phospholipase C domain-containing protein n=1 Tax=Photobacterium damselae TaxID=38293 RepID=UPI001F1F36FD|nr:phosphatidylinositol-specific phospholipase C domain-containing protein [Photobacterium damselae]UKA04007.1 phosphatidylinositol-specific phospholipase C domain-containing protein [Photobacterium damselae subsp. damselae]
MKIKYTSLICLFMGINSVSFANEPSDYGEIIDPGYMLDYLYDGYAGYRNTHWMSAIPDSRKLSEISIPGTHNSLSKEPELISQTQTLSLYSQLQAGVRFFDIRMKYINGSLYAYHGPISQKTTFKQTISVISDFLDRYPSESILIMLSNESGASHNAEKFWDRYNQVINEFSSYYINPKSDDPTLGEVRGKFTIISKFRHYDPVGIEYRSMDVQDDYHISSNWALHDKWNKVKHHFLKSKHGISVNYLSASGGSFPYFVASGKSSQGSHAPQLLTGSLVVNDPGVYPDFPRVGCLGYLCSIAFAGTNQLTSKWIQEDKLPDNLGIVVADFIGPRLIHNIIASNDTTLDCVSIYEHNNYSGINTCISEDTAYVGHWFNDKLSSYKIPKNWVVRFYTHENYQGGYYTRTGNHRSDIDLNDKISSIKILSR